ncbi:MAG: isochorismatase family protein, partial [Promethearchaeota archaeon]
TYQDCRNEWKDFFIENKIRGKNKGSGGLKNDLEYFIATLTNKIKSNNIKTTSKSSKPLVKYSYHNILRYFKHMVHIDNSECERIWNEEGKLSQTINELKVKAEKANNNQESNEKYYFIHIRDWHDPTNPYQYPEFQNFGFHCIKGSHGADFIKPIEDLITSDSLEQYNIVIDSNTLSCFAGTELDYVLRTIIKNENLLHGNVEMGVFGLVTNIKVKLLAYELNEIYGYKDINICKDLSAGFYNKKHHDGLDYIEEILGIKVLSLEEFKSKFNF